jgi:hypothetical protein
MKFMLGRENVNTKKGFQTTPPPMPVSESAAMQFLLLISESATTQLLLPISESQSAAT